MASVTVGTTLPFISGELGKKETAAAASGGRGSKPAQKLVRGQVLPGDKLTTTHSPLLFLDHEEGGFLWSNVRGCQSKASVDKIIKTCR